MFKYDDVISTLTLLNTLARDPNYGNCKQAKDITCELDEAQNYELCAFENSNLVVLQVCNFCKKIFNVENILQFKLLVRNLQKYFYRCMNVCENLIIFLQKMVLYNLQSLLDYL